VGVFTVLFSPITAVFHWVFYEPVFNILMLIYHGVGNFALAIVLLTLVIRGALFPLTKRQLSSTRKMQELQPRLKEIQAKHRGDPQATMAAQQALYKEHGVSMYGGCLPLLIQMPFLYSLFYAFETVLNNKTNALASINHDIYPFLPHLTQLPDMHFLWMTLNAPDPKLILPILAGLLTFVQMRMAMPVRRPGAAPDPTQQTAKSMQYVMPVFTFFLGTRFASGLALYWTVSTGFSAAQQYLLSGFGSLFVGVPGMERFVPAPKDAPAPALPARSTGAAGAASAAANEPQKSPGFFANIREMMNQAREAQAQALVAQREQAGKVVEADAGSGAVESDTSTSASRSSAPNPAPRDRRQRPPKSGAMLVRPSMPSESSSDLAAPSGELPEDRIARDAQASMDGIIADTGERLNNGASNAAAASAQRPGAGSSGAQRRNQQTRGRNRPKGGR
jgi:YidC/Oxa1 family membrane protein insertase